MGGFEFRSGYCLDWREWKGSASVWRERKRYTVEERRERGEGGWTKGERERETEENKERKEDKSQRRESGKGEEVEKEAKKTHRAHCSAFAYVLHLING